MDPDCHRCCSTFNVYQGMLEIGILLGWSHLKALVGFWLDRSKYIVEPPTYDKGRKR